MSPNTIHETFEPGTPVFGHTDSGFIVEQLPAPDRAYMLGSGIMEKINAEYSVVWINGDDQPRGISQLSDVMIAPMIARARHASAPAADNLAELVTQARATQTAQREQAATERAAADETRQAFKHEAAEKMPPWAKAVIVAQLDCNESDSMTDYFAHSTERTLILAWSKHTRDLFPEMRKAAAAVPETAHLGPDLGVFWPRVVASVDWYSGGSHHYKGEHSHGHGELNPETSFATRAEAEKFIADKGEPYSVQDGDALVTYEWHIDETKIEHREKYSMGGGYYLKDGSDNASGWRVTKYELYHGADSVPVGEWRIDDKPAPRSAPGRPQAAGGVTVAEYTHTKKGFQFWLVTLADRVDRGEFETLRDQCKAAGGWYSRQWGKTPGGFAFDNEPDALTFAATIGNGGPPPGGPRPDTADRLRELANGMQAGIDSKLGDRRTNTPKQQREAASARLDGHTMERAQAGLRLLADAHEAGDVPAALATVRTKKRALELARSKLDHSNCRYYDAPIDTGQPRDDEPATLAFWLLVEGHGTHDAAAEDLRRRVEALKFSQIPGYFPTPPDLVQRMIDEAEIEDGQTVLEPSAGSGAIIDGLQHLPSVIIGAYERNATLAQILRDKGWTLLGSDFLEADEAVKFDRIVMNPPFENLADIDHVRKAWACLKPGGRIVAIMSAGAFACNGARLKVSEFHDWMTEIDGTSEDLPAGTFKESGTGVASRLVILAKA